MNPHVIGGMWLLGRLADKGRIQGPWQVDSEKVREHLMEFPPEERGGPDEWVSAALRVMNMQGTLEIRGEKRDVRGVSPEDEAAIMVMLMDEARELDR